MIKKLSTMSIFALILLSMHIMAQTMTVKGKVNEEDGTPLYGVNVAVKGTTNGTITEVDGTYSIQAKSGETLTFSYVGFLAQDIPVEGLTVINVVLKSNDKVLEEVVVTALGVSREKRALQYSVTELKGESFTKVRVNNLGNALSGRVAGVSVSTPSTGSAGSSRVIIRGNKTLAGNNQPLYVIDGVPIDNSQQGVAGKWGGADGGDGLSSLNPDDIESITVLKGANAAALYGSRGGNGVINISTKKGTKRKGIGLDFNSSFVFDLINDQSDMQTKYGMGNYVDGVAQAPETVAQASDWGLLGWGSALDGRMVPSIDGVSRRYSYAGNNFKRFYRLGTSWINSVALSGGNSQQNFRLSLADMKNNDIMPNSGFDRTNASISTNSKFGKRITLNGRILYSREFAKNRPRISDSPGNANEAVWRLPANVDVTDLRGDPNKLGAIPGGIGSDVLAVGQRSAGNELLLNHVNVWGSNPYWSAYQHANNSKRDRITASAQLKYDLTDFLYVTGRISIDNSYRNAEIMTPEGTGYNTKGAIKENLQQQQENNIDYMIGYHNIFNKFSVNAFIGGNRQRNLYKQIGAKGSGFSVQFFQALNVSNNRNFEYNFKQSGINSLYGSTEFGWDNYLFFTITARNDWFSVLNPESNSILYPAIGGSFIFTDAFSEAMPAWLSFGKVRASWAQVGLIGSLEPYQTTQPYGIFADTHLGRSLGGFANRNTIANRNLKPALSTETELGFDIRILKDRLGVDFGYYSQKTTKDILNATISLASGFKNTTINVGELQNKGIEFLVYATPIKARDFQWDISINFSKNRNKVLHLIDKLDELVFEDSRTQTTFIKHIVGHPFGVITGITQKTINGKPVFTKTGLPVRNDTYKIIGNSVPDFTGGINNSFTYKSLGLSFLIDARFGGSIHSGTNQSLDQWGFSKNSLQGRLNEQPLTIDGVNEDGEPLNLTLTPDQAAAYWGMLGTRNASTYLYDASFLKLRQLVLSYHLPKELVNKTPFQSIGISFVSRNLAVLWKNIPNIDPESTYSTNGGAQGLEYFALPATRSYGFNLNISY